MQRMLLLSMLLITAFGGVTSRVTTYAGKCLGNMPSTPHNWDTQSVFDSLSTKEISAVIDYLTSVNSLGVKPIGEAFSNDTYILSIERMLPPKTSVLAYLNSNRTTPMPQRYARAVLVRGDLTTPIIEEYKVGPLPNPNEHVLLKYPKYPNGIPFKARQLIPNPVEFIPMIIMVDIELRKLNPLFNESTGGFTYGNGCGDKCLRFNPHGPIYGNVTRRTHWFWLARDVEGLYVHNIGVQFRVNVDSQNPFDWNIGAIWFRGKLFNSTDALLEAYLRNELRVVPDKVPPRDETLFSSLHRRGKPVPEVPRRGPKPRMLDGRRFQVHGHHVSWLSWEFEYNVQTSTGPQVFDARFNGERIVYDMSLQEVFVYYSGNNPGILYQTYFDSTMFLADNTKQLIPGVDCPEHAVYMDFAHYLFGDFRIERNTSCVFEHRSLVPLRRHYSPGKYAQGMSDDVLVVRTVITLANYDYIYDVIFRQNGAIETRISLCGFISGTRYTGPQDNPYGFQVADDIVGALHAHFLHVKVDLDIKSTSNQFATLNLEQVAVQDMEGNGNTVYINRFVKDQKKTEKEAVYKYNFDTPKYMLFYNDEQQNKNKWGHERSYRLLPLNMAKSLIPEGYAWENAASWIRQQVAVTKQHDNEDTISTSYNQMMSKKPVVSLQDFIDNDENITDQDLVAWVTLGTHHIPHTEDLPVTATSGVQLSFMLLPYNYFDEDPSMASRDNVRVSSDGKFEYYGNHVTDDCSDSTGSAISLSPLSVLLYVSLCATIIIT